MKKEVSKYNAEEIAIFYRDYPDKGEALELLCDMTGYSVLVVREILRYKGLLKPSELDALPGMDLYEQISFLLSLRYKKERIMRYLGCSSDVVCYVRKREIEAVNE